MNTTASAPRYRCTESTHDGGGRRAKRVDCCRPVRTAADANAQAMMPPARAVSHQICDRIPSARVRCGHGSARGGTRRGRRRDRARSRSSRGSWGCRHRCDRDAQGGGRSDHGRGCSRYRRWRRALPCDSHGRHDREETRDAQSGEQDASRRTGSASSLRPLGSRPCVVGHRSMPGRTPSVQPTDALGQLGLGRLARGVVREVSHRGALLALALRSGLPRAQSSGRARLRVRAALPCGQWRLDQAPAR